MTTNFDKRIEELKKHNEKNPSFVFHNHIDNKIDKNNEIINAASENNISNDGSYKNNQKNSLNEIYRQYLKAAIIQLNNAKQYEIDELKKITNRDQVNSKENKLSENNDQNTLKIKFKKKYLESIKKKIENLTERLRFLEENINKKPGEINEKIKKDPLYVKNNETNKDNAKKIEEKLKKWLALLTNEIELACNYQFLNNWDKKQNIYKCLCDARAFYLWTGIDHELSKDEDIDNVILQTTAGHKTITVALQPLENGNKIIISNKPMECTEEQIREFFKILNEEKKKQPLWFRKLYLKEKNGTISYSWKQKYLISIMIKLKEKWDKINNEQSKSDEKQVNENEIKIYNNDDNDEKIIKNDKESNEKDKNNETISNQIIVNNKNEDINEKEKINEENNIKEIKKSEKIPYQIRKDFNDIFSHITSLTSDTPLIKNSNINTVETYDKEGKKISEETFYTMGNLPPYGIDKKKAKKFSFWSYLSHIHVNLPALFLNNKKNKKEEEIKESEEKKELLRIAKQNVYQAITNCIINNQENKKKIEEEVKKKKEAIEEKNENNIIKNEKIKENEIKIIENNSDENNNKTTKEELIDEKNHEVENKIKKKLDKKIEIEIEIPKIMFQSFFSPAKNEEAYENFCKSCMSIGAKGSYDDNTELLETKNKAIEKVKKEIEKNGMSFECQNENGQEIGITVKPEPGKKNNEKETNESEENIEIKTKNINKKKINNKFKNEKHNKKENKKNIDKIISRNTPINEFKGVNPNTSFLKLLFKLKFSNIKEYLKAFFANLISKKNENYLNELIEVLESTRNHFINEYNNNEQVKNQIKKFENDKILPEDFKKTLFSDQILNITNCNLTKYIANMRYLLNCKIKDIKDSKIGDEEKNNEINKIIRLYFCITLITRMNANGKYKNEYCNILKSILLNMILKFLKYDLFANCKSGKDRALGNFEQELADRYFIDRFVEGFIARTKKENTNKNTNINFLSRLDETLESLGISENPENFFLQTDIYLNIYEKIINSNYTRELSLPNGSCYALKSRKTVLFEEIQKKLEKNKNSLPIKDEQKLAGFNKISLKHEDFYSDKKNTISLMLSIFILPLYITVETTKSFLGKNLFKNKENRKNDEKNNIENIENNEKINNNNINITENKQNNLSSNDSKIQNTTKVINFLNKKNDVKENNDDTKIEIKEIKNNNEKSIEKIDLNPKLTIWKTAGDITKEIKNIFTHKKQ